MSANMEAGLKAMYAIALKRSGSRINYPDGRTMGALVQRGLVNPPTAQVKRHIISSAGVAYLIDKYGEDNIL